MTRVITVYTAERDPVELFDQDPHGITGACSGTSFSEPLNSRDDGWEGLTGYVEVDPLPHLRCASLDSTGKDRSTPRDREDVLNLKGEWLHRLQHGDVLAAVKPSHCVLRMVLWWGELKNIGPLCA